MEELNQTESIVADEKVLLSTRESKSIADALDALANKEGLSRSKFISKLVHRELNQSEASQKPCLHLLTVLNDRLQRIESVETKLASNVKVLVEKSDEFQQIQAISAAHQKTLGAHMHDFSIYLENALASLRRDFRLQFIAQLVIEIILNIAAICVAFGAFPWKLWDITRRVSPF